jgi:DNA-binding CsgD family transcriptional regulator
LTPRLRGVLTLLIDGRNRNEIAQSLKLSPHTVKDHIKAIYRHFGVSTHPQLMRLFQFGNGNDVAYEQQPELEPRVIDHEPGRGESSRQEAGREDGNDVEPDASRYDPEDSGTFAAIVD